MPLRIQRCSRAFGNVNFCLPKRYLDGFSGCNLGLSGRRAVVGYGLDDCLGFLLGRDVDRGRVGFVLHGHDVVAREEEFQSVAHRVVRLHGEGCRGLAVADLGRNGEHRSACRTGHVVQRARSNTRKVG